MGLSGPFRAGRSLFRTSWLAGLGPIRYCPVCRRRRLVEARASIAILSAFRSTATTTSSPSANRSFATLMQRLTRAGFGKDFVRQAILPDWWDESASADPDLLQDLEIRIARFIGVSVSALRDSRAPIAILTYPSAKLRRVRDMSRDQLGPAMLAAMRVASVVVRNLRSAAEQPATIPAPPADGLEWRAALTAAHRAPTLKVIATDLWARGIPVVPLEFLPAPTFQGLACVVAQRPVILLGHKNDEPGRVAHLVAHEAGHVAAGDCQPDAPVVDEEDEIADDSDMEKRAERYATHVLVGSDQPPALDVDSRDFKELAQRALDLERETGADASAIIFGWARETLDYATATMAAKAIYRASGARRQLQELFARHVNVEDASETDRDLLRCVLGGVPPHEVAH